MTEFKMSDLFDGVEIDGQMYVPFSLLRDSISRHASSMEFVRKMVNAPTATILKRLQELPITNLAWIRAQEAMMKEGASGKDVVTAFLQSIIEEVSDAD